jgi:hypothetical protein
LVFTRFETLHEYLRSEQVIENGLATVQAIQELVNSRIIPVDNIHEQNTPIPNIRVLLAAFLITSNPLSVFEHMGTLDNKLLAAASAFVAILESIAFLLHTEQSFDAIPHRLTASFSLIIKAYMDCFHDWKTPDEDKIKKRIRNAIRALNSALLSTSIEDEDQRLQLNTNIERLQIKLAQIGGQEALDAVNEELLANPPQPVPPSPTQILQPQHTATSIADWKMSHEQIAYEVYLDNSFQFNHAHANSSSANQPLINAFWINMQNNLEMTPEPSFDIVYRVLNNFKTGICEIIEQGTVQGLKDEVQELINIDEMRNSRKMLDKTTRTDFLVKIADIILRVQNPKRNEETRTVWATFQSELQDSSPDEQPAAIVKAIKFLMRSLDEVRMDLSNDRIRMLSPIMQNHGTEYLQAKLQEGLDSGALKLDNTTNWLSHQIDCITVKDLKKIVMGDQDTFRMMHRSALVDIIVNQSLTSDKMPEVFRFDKQRLENFSEQFRKFVTCATIIRIIGSFINVNRTLTETHDTQQKTLLESISNTVLSHNPKSTDDIKQLLDTIKATYPEELCPEFPEHMDALQTELEMSISDPHFHIRSTV